MHTTCSSSWRDITLISHRPEWVKWFRRLPVVPHTPAPPRASAIMWCHWGSKSCGIFCMYWRIWGMEGVGVGVRKRGRRAILSWCGALSDFGPDPAGYPRFPLLLEAAVWALCLALFVSSSLVRYEAVVQLVKPRQPTSMGITWQAHLLSSRSMHRFSKWGFFLSKASSMFPPQVQQCQFNNDAWLSQTKWQCLVIPGHAWCGVGSEELLLGQLPSSSHLWLV